MAKSESPFDKLIKNKLDEFHLEDSSAPDWSFMQQKIDEAESDLEFDQKIKQALDGLKVDSPQIKWEKFHERNIRQIARRNKIIAARIIESCLFLLLLWTMDNIGITNIIAPLKHSDYKLNPIAELNSIDLFHKEQDAEQTSFDLVTNEPSPANQMVNIDDPNKKGFDRKKMNNTKSLDEKSLHKKLSKPTFINPLTDPNTSSEANAIGNTSIEINGIPSAVSESVEPTQPIEQIQESEAAPQLPIDDHLINETETISALDSKINALVIKNSKLDFDKQLPTINQIIKPAIIQKSVVLNVHAGLMANVIQSPPYTDPNATSLYTQLRPGFQTAINIGFQSRNYMLESGLTYQNFSYDPNISEKIYLKDGAVRLQFNKINAQIISIPVLIHFNLIKQALWSVSAKAGLSLSVSLKNDFHLDSTYYYCQKGHNSIFFDTNPYSEIRSRVSNPTYQGVLDGGDFGVNSFSNIIAGIRYERRLNSNLSFYSEIELSKMIGSIGFGPNGDRFISTNLNTGLSFKL